jgi:shikimate kinase
MEVLSKNRGGKRVMENVILIGMPGSGKSTVGVVLAKVLGYRFVDSDLLIQEAEGKRLHEIIAEKGIEGFLEVENKVNSQIEVTKSVIATGGSVVYEEEAMEHLKKIGTVVYLRIPYKNLKRRLGSLKDRGVVLKEGQTLKDLYNERTPLYEKYAEVIVDENDMGLRETIEKVTEALKR